MKTLDSYPLGFEEVDDLRSDFIRALTLQQLEDSATVRIDSPSCLAVIPKTLVQYWHDPLDVPDDVQACLASWKRLAYDGFEFRTFNDVSGAAYIADTYGARESAAFGHCRHPAMRCDYFRICYLLAEGGLYVDADDVLLSDAWKVIFRDGRLKMQPLCYDIASHSMVAAAEIWRADLLTTGRIFYVNNDPIAAPAGHPILRRALSRATQRLLGEDPRPEIQATTGPGNFTAALAAHARELLVAEAPLDFEFLGAWEEIAETRWELSYRRDARNWRNMDESARNGETTR